MARRDADDGPGKAMLLLQDAKRRPVPNGVKRARAPSSTCDSDLASTSPSVSPSRRAAATKKHGWRSRNPGIISSHVAKENFYFTQPNATPAPASLPDCHHSQSTALLTPNQPRNTLPCGDQNTFQIMSVVLHFIRRRRSNESVRGGIPPELTSRALQLCEPVLFAVRQLREVAHQGGGRKYALTSPIIRHQLDILSHYCVNIADTSAAASADTAAKIALVLPLVKKVTDVAGTASWIFRCATTMFRCRAARRPIIEAMTPDFFSRAAASTQAVISATGFQAIHEMWAVRDAFAQAFAESLESEARELISLLEAIAFREDAGGAGVSRCDEYGPFLETLELQMMTLCVAKLPTAALIAANTPAQPLSWVQRCALHPGKLPARLTAGVLSLHANQVASRVVVLTPRDVVVAASQPRRPSGRRDAASPDPHL